MVVCFFHLYSRRKNVGKVKFVQTFYEQEKKHSAKFQGPGYRTTKKMHVLTNYDVCGDLIYCQRLRRSTTIII